MNLPPENEYETVIRKWKFTLHFPPKILNIAEIVGINKSDSKKNTNYCPKQRKKRTTNTTRSSEARAYIYNNKPYKS